MPNLDASRCIEKMKDEILLELRSQFDANVKIVTVQDEDFQNVITANAMQK